MTTTATGASTGAKKLLGGVLFVLVSVAVVAGVGLYLHSASADPQPPLFATAMGMTDTPQGKMNTASIELSVFADSASSNNIQNANGSHPGFVTYGPSTHLVLPAHSLIKMKIYGYDGGEKLNNPYFARVVGTVDGTMMLNGKSVTGLTDAQVQHTFTLHGLPTSSQDPLFLNVPLMIQSEEAMTKFDESGTLPTPNVMEFSFYTKGPGEYVWNCEYPCGDGTYAKFGAAMSKYGFMSGKVTVK
ncbi:MAG: hypothetical protein WCJ91_03655 [Actinomycetes bacterium]